MPCFESGASGYQHPGAQALGHATGVDAEGKGLRNDNGKTVAMLLDILNRRVYLRHRNYVGYVGVEK